MVALPLQLYLSETVFWEPVFPCSFHFCEHYNLKKKQSLIADFKVDFKQILKFKVGWILQWSYNTAIALFINELM